MKFKSVVAALVMAGTAVAGVVLYNTHSPIVPEPLPMGALPPKSSPTSVFSFTPLDKPRPLAEISFTNGNGRALSLADFRGQVVLLNICATWCAPCRKEMPTLDRLQTTLGGPDFQVVALSIDRKGREVVEPFYKELGLSALGLYHDVQGNVLRAFNVVGVPTTLLIDQQGREIGRVHGPAEWDSEEVVTVIRRYLDVPSTAKGETSP